MTPESKNAGTLLQEYLNWRHLFIAVMGSS
jgi:hypothetical protein